MITIYLLELDLTANNIAIVSGLPELIVPEKHRPGHKQLYIRAGLDGGRNWALWVFRGDQSLQFLRILKR